MDEGHDDTAVLFEKALSATVWFLGRIAAFPKDQRYIVGRRMSDVILEFDVKLVRAWRAGRKERLLDDLAALLDQIRFYLRLSVEMKFISPAQFKHGSELCRDVGPSWSAFRTTSADSAMSSSSMLKNTFPRSIMRSCGGF